MRVDQSIPTARSNRADDLAAAQASFQGHMQAAGARSRGTNDNANVVTVKRGDTLSDIAQRHRVSMADLYHANPEFNPRRQDGVLHFDRGKHGGWDPDYIRPGDRINLPSALPVQPHSPAQPQPPSGRPHQPAQPHPPGGHPHQPAQPHPPGGHSHQPAQPHPPSGYPHRPTQPTPTAPNPSSPSNPSAGPSPTPTPHPSNPSNPSVPVNPAPTPGGSHQQHGAPPVIPIAPYSQAFRGGIGIEAAARANAKPTLGGEPYVKGSWAVAPHWNINGKIKYTPRGKLNITALNANGKAAPDPNAPRPPNPSLRERIKAALPEKLTVDAGLVYDKRVEGGASLEIKFGKGVTRTLSTYLSKKDPTNVLVDSAQLKFGKLSPRKIGSALVDGTRDSLAQSKFDAKAGGRWSPLRQQVWKAVNGGEITLAGERAYINPHGSVSGFLNIAGKTTFKDVGQGLEHPAAAPGLTRFTGFAAGTAASFGGAWVTDQLIGKEIHSPELRRAVDGFGGAMAGLVADPVAQKVVPAVASKIAPTVTRLAEPLVSKAAPLMSEAAPVLSKVGELASKIPLGATGRVLSKVARIGGPAGALVAGIPDGIDAFKAFQKGDTADGWRAVGHGAVRVAGTAVGAVVGQALIPIPGVGAAVGAVAGGFVGDLVAKLF